MPPGSFEFGTSWAANGQTAKEHRRQTKNTVLARLFIWVQSPCEATVCWNGWCACHWGLSGKAKDPSAKPAINFTLTSNSFSIRGLAGSILDHFRPCCCCQGAV